MVSLDDIAAASAAITHRVHRTPLFRSTALGRRLGVRLHLKAENLQKTGSFKPRGVFNKLRQLSAEEKARGLVTVSAGNHGQALAFAAAEEGIRCTVVAPASASRAKVDAMREYGADVILIGDASQAFEKMGQMQAERGLTLVHPYNDPAIIAGQGTIGLEILEDMPELDAVIVPVGGGGLIAGIATAVKFTSSIVKVFGVEPYGAPTVHRAREQGEPVWLDSIRTVADGLTAPVAGDVPLPIINRLVDDVVLVSDEEIVAAMRAILERTKLLVEPAGAAGVAALLSGRIRLPEAARVVVLLSGGNIDLERLRDLL